MLDDRLPVDGIGERLTHAHVRQDRVAHVQADVGVVDAGRGRQLDVAAAFELVDDVGREVVDVDVDRALAQLEAAHGVVRHDLQDEPGIARRAVEVAVEALEDDAVVGGRADEGVRAGADRLRRLILRVRA